VNLGALAVIMISFLAIFGFIVMRADETQTLIKTDFEVMNMRKEFVENRPFNNSKLDDLEIQGEES